MAQPWTDRKIEDIVGNLLRTGVLMSAAIVVCGAGFYLSRHGMEGVSYHQFHGEPGEFRTVAGIVRHAFAFSGRGLIQLGLLFLIATPVARVAFAIWGFAAERDWMYVGFTVVVLAVLLYSLLGAT